MAANFESHRRQQCLNARRPWAANTWMGVAGIRFSNRQRHNNGNRCLSSTWLDRFSGFFYRPGPSTARDIRSNKCGGGKDHGRRRSHGCQAVCSAPQLGAKNPSHVSIEPQCHDRSAASLPCSTRAVSRRARSMSYYQQRDNLASQLIGSDRSSAVHRMSMDRSAAFLWHRFAIVCGAQQQKAVDQAGLFRHIVCQALSCVVKARRSENFGGLPGLTADCVMCLIEPVGTPLGYCR